MVVINRTNSVYDGCFVLYNKIIIDDRFQVIVTIYILCYYIRHQMRGWFYQSSYRLQIQERMVENIWKEQLFLEQRRKSL